MTGTNLACEDFAEFFSALWGKDVAPFAWQLDLARRVMGEPESDRHSWPEAIALPTGAGKTACLDIAVFALAAQAQCDPVSGHWSTSAPRRIFFVVDRRIIVDEAHKRARLLAGKLKCALRSEQDGILRLVAERLLRLACGGPDKLHNERSLAVHSLRGGMYRSEAWARNPLQPTIVASTVDQIGSRLLFRAYGRWRGTWPVYAGLVANDSLILLDEAHCAQPFLQTLQAVRKYREWAKVPLGRCFHPVVMSATPPPGIEDVFRDSSGEGRDPMHLLGRRQLAEKSARIHPPVKVARGQDPHAALAAELAEHSLELVEAGLLAVVVFANRVATARKTREILANSTEAKTEVLLLTGRMRAVDKEAVVNRLEELKLHSGQSNGRVLSKPVIVVATQTLEVGADLDFDGLVTECASLDALRQRFGRLNRMGRELDSRAHILMRADQVAGDDPVYGKALANTWKFLEEIEKDAGNEMDFGIAAMQGMLDKKGDLAELNAPAKAAPVMLPSHVDCWGQTWPEPMPSPDVAPFLRGAETGAPDVHICWRADLDLSSEDGKKYALESLSLCPPSSSETLAVPIGTLRKWLENADALDESADVPHNKAEDEDGHGGGESQPEAPNVVRWKGAQTSLKHVTSLPEALRPGAIIVFPANPSRAWHLLGDGLPDAQESPGLLDAGDQGYRLARAKPILRLHPALVHAWPDALEAKSTALDLLVDLGQRYEDDSSEIGQELRALLKELAASEIPAEDAAKWDWLRKAAKELKDEFSTPAKLQREFRFVGAQSLVLVGHRRISELAGEADTFSDEDDMAASGLSYRNGQPVPLRAHLPGVEKYAQRHALGCGLPEDLAEAVARAGLLHDLGKADIRFQGMLRGGVRWLAANGEPLAKSGQMPRSRAARQAAHRASGYPAGGRHELLSVRLAESAPALLPDAGHRDLVLHLVASHHGRCRPFAPVVADDEAPSAGFELRGHNMSWAGPTGLERLDSGIADRYWRLTRRYGWWGLAWLEALLRLADWRRSEWEETHDAEE